MLEGPPVSQNTRPYRDSEILELLCVMAAALPAFCFLLEIDTLPWALSRFALAIVPPLGIGGTRALAMVSRRGSKRSLGTALNWELIGLLGLALAWLTALWEAYFWRIDLLRFFVFSTPLALGLVLKTACCTLIAVRYRDPRERWLETISLSLSFFVVAAWIAQIAFILADGGVNKVEILRWVVLYDTVPPGICGIGMLVAATVARHRQRARGARMLEFGGIVALLLALLVTSVVVGAIHKTEAYADLVLVTNLLIGAKVISEIVIGGIRWSAGKSHFAAQSNSPQAALGAAGIPNEAALGSRPVGRVPDLLSFLAVLFTWFCVVPMPPSLSNISPIVIPGPSMFISGFPVGLVGAVALLAAGLLRAGRDRNRLVALELFGVVALTMIYTAAALPFATRIAGLTSISGTRDAWIVWLIFLSWALFGMAMAAKLVYIAAGLIRRRERMQFGLLGMLAFIVGCGALAMYWRLWRS